MAEISYKNGNQHYPMRVEPVEKACKEKKVKAKKQKPHRPKVGKYGFVSDTYSVIWDETVSQLRMVFKTLDEYPPHVIKNTRLKKLLPEKRTGGNLAVRAGKAIEIMVRSTIEDVMSRHPHVTHRKYNATYETTNPDDIFCVDPEGNVINVDERIYGLKEYPIGVGVEIKFQSSSGSGDEKPEHLVANIINSFPCPAIVISAYEAKHDSKPGTKRKLASILPRYERLLKEHKDAGGKKFVAVMSPLQFPAWLNKEADK